MPWSKFETSETSCRKFSPRTQASCEVALEIAKHENTQMVGETLVNPYLLITVKLLPGEASEAKTRRIYLSRDTVQRGISDMLEDVKDQIIN